MTILCGLDFETSGLDPKKDKIIEAGFCLWDTERGPLKMKSYLINQPVILSDEIVKITGITQEMMETGYPESKLIEDINRFHGEAFYWIAHNAPFEAGFIDALFPYSGKPVMLWIDTLTDLPDRQGSGKLTYLAADHGFVNPFPHRALPDVLSMMKVLSLYDFAEVERHALAPTITLRVAFGYDPEKVAAIKALGGWRFHSETKEWRKDIKEFNLQAEIDKAHAAGFQPLAPQKAGVA